MSGRPYPEGVARAVRLLDDCSRLASEVVNLQSEAKQLAERLSKAESEHASASTELQQLLMSMDLTSPGNFGYAARLSWFLSEMRRQTAVRP